MNEFQLDLNPFPEKERLKLTDAERQVLFTNAQGGDEDALNKLVAAYAPRVESIVLQLQPENIPTKYTFTELYDAGIAALKRVILTTEEKKFDEFVGWCVRQSIITAFKK